MRAVILAFAVGLTAWLIGFGLFVSDLPKTTPSVADLSGADGIAVYTGGGGARIRQAMALFADGVGDRLLISGVNEATSRAALAELWPGEASRYECCVDFGRTAGTTPGNAAETASWARRHEFSTVILVTSDYHMRRAALETRRAAPDLRLIPVAAPSRVLDERGWPASARAWRTLSGEYMKSLIARAAGPFAGDG